MHNYLKVGILSTLILLILLTIYVIMDDSSSKETLEIQSIPVKAIKITPIEVIAEKSIEKKTSAIRPVDILSKLKIATEQSKTAIVPPKEEQKKQVVDTLNKPIKKPPIKKVLVKTKITKKKVTKKKVIIKKVVKSKKSNPVRKRVVTLKKEVPSPKKQASQKTTKQLSREEEVALYHKQHAKTLEIVNVSDNFEIKEENLLPDSHYFESQKEVKDVQSDEPLKFVKKLGVVTVSNKYEKGFIIPKKEELAKEGIVNISNASLETEEIKKLDFVAPLGIVEVSQEFETIDANNYLN